MYNFHYLVIRLDYGTGHTSSFQITLYALFQIGVFGNNNPLTKIPLPPTKRRLKAATLLLWNAYLDVADTRIAKGLSIGTCRIARCLGFGRLSLPTLLLWCPTVGTPPRVRPVGYLHIFRPVELDQGGIGTLRTLRGRSCFEIARRAALGLWDALFCHVDAVSSVPHGSTDGNIPNHRGDGANSNGIHARHASAVGQIKRKSMAQLLSL